MNVVKRVPFVAFLFVLGLADAVIAQAPRSRSQRIDPLTASISGQVTTADTGAPIRGMRVPARFSILLGIALSVLAAFGARRLLARCRTPQTRALALAGMTLVFAVEITEVRDATEEESSHGHTHGDGGHQHG